MNEKQLLEKAHEILSSDFAFEADMVTMDVINGEKVSNRERALAKVVHDLYALIHPYMSECCKHKN